MIHFVISMTIMASTFAYGAGNSCVKNLAPKSPARQEFESYTSYSHYRESREINRQTPSEAFYNIRDQGHTVSFLLKDGRYEGGEKLVIGYIYDVIESRGPIMKAAEYLKSLSPQERNRVTRGKRMDSQSRVAPLIRTLVITTVAPYFRAENGKVVAQGWLGQPPKGSLKKIVLGSEEVLEARYTIAR